MEERTPPPPPSEPPPLIVRFGLIVYFGLIVEITMDFFRCFAHGFQMGEIHIEWDNLLPFVFGMSVFIGLLALALFLQEKLKIDFNKNRVTFVATFIVIAVVGGWFNLSVCGKESKQKNPTFSDTRNQALSLRGDGTG